jgi:hypothetical protein
MNPLEQMIEAILLGGRLLVTFADGQIASLESGPIYRLAVSSEAFLTPPPQELI